MQRRHRVVTVPSGLAVFACIALPGYSDCGHTVAIRESTPLAAICILGLVIAISALVMAMRRREFGIAVASCSIAGASLLVMVFTAISSTPYAGVMMGSGSLLGLVGGTVLWILETRGRRIGVVALGLLGLGTLAALAVAASESDWDPPPQTKYVDMLR